MRAGASGSGKTRSASTINRRLAPTGVHYTAIESVTCTCGTAFNVMMTGYLIIEFRDRSHLHGQEAWHRILRGELAQALPVGEEWAVTRTEGRREEAFSVRRLARNNISAIPVNAPAVRTRSRDCRLRQIIIYRVIVRVDINASGRRRFV